MMNNSTANKSHIPCQSWADQNSWSATPSQGPIINPLTDLQHLSVGSSSHQRPSYDHLSGQSCMSNLNTLSSSNNVHHAALYKAPHGISSSTMLFSNTTIPSTSHTLSFAQPHPHTSSMLMTANQGVNIPTPSLPQTNQGMQPSGSQHLPLLSGGDPYKASFQTPDSSHRLTNGLQDLPMTLPACAQHEPPQWIPSSHCRGAVNKSDAAVHPDKVSSPEGNLPPPISGETRRSAILQQRAQLLKQLAEMEQLLESLPPDEGSDRQSPHTATQSNLSADCSSPSCRDEEKKACETPEDPESAAESEKNDSAESGDDGDADYVPDGDSDLSDVKSETNDCSSDEDGHSSPSTPTDKKPPASGRKRIKSESSASEDESVPPPKKSCATDWKKPSETVVLPLPSSEAECSKRRRNYCLFCSKSVAKMSRHLEGIHSDKAEVAAAFQYPKHSKERQKIWNKLINEGNFAHNKNVLKTGEGELVARKRPHQPKRGTDFLHCLYCRGLFYKRNLFRHLGKCPEREKNENEPKIGRKSIASQCALEIADLGISDGVRRILTDLAYNDVAQIIMDDQTILQFAEELYKKYGSNANKDIYIRQNLRQIARLVLEAQNITPMHKLEDFFHASNFTHVVSAVKVVAGYNPENKTYSAPSFAIKIGHILKKICCIVKRNAVERGDTKLAKSARNFLRVYEKKWTKLISSSALTNMKETRSNTSKQVPSVEDVKHLNFHLENVHHKAEKKLRECTTVENYAALAKVILPRIMIFNRRVSREVSTIKLKEFMSRKMSNVQDNMDASVSNLERTMCEFLVRIEVRGSSGRMVPILLTRSFESALELLVNVRKECVVSSKNPFLFARPRALTAYYGPVCLQKFTKECGAKNPEVLTSVKIRTHFSKMLQLMNLEENEASRILGPNNKVHILRENIGATLHDLDMESGGRLQSASRHHSKHSREGRGAESLNHQRAPRATAPSKSFASEGEVAQNKSKHKWEEAEVAAVERHLMSFIKDHKVPQKNNCMQCLEAEPEALRSRTWRGVKDYVRNRITTLRRQNGCSRDSSKKP